MNALAEPNREALKVIADAKNRKARVVFTNGCFDLIHVGHVRYLTEARALGDLLVVGVNSDASVRRLKGPERPFIPLDDRCEVLRSLRAVDLTCVFEDDTPLSLIQQVRPDVLVKGGDWPKEKIVGADFVESYGGTVRSLPFVPGHSTTEIARRISG